MAAAAALPMPAHVWRCLRSRSAWRGPIFSVAATTTALQRLHRIEKGTAPETGTRCTVPNRGEWVNGRELPRCGPIGVHAFGRDVSGATARMRSASSSPVSALHHLTRLAHATHGRLGVPCTPAGLSGARGHPDRARDGSPERAGPCAGAQCRGVAVTTRRFKVELTAVPQHRLSDRLGVLRRR